MTMDIFASTRRPIEAMRWHHRLRSTQCDAKIDKSA